MKGAEIYRCGTTPGSRAEVFVCRDGTVGVDVHEGSGVRRSYVSTGDIPRLIAQLQGVQGEPLGNSEQLPSEGSMEVRIAVVTSRNPVSGKAVYVSYGSDRENDLKDAVYGLGDNGGGRDIETTWALPLFEYHPSQ